MRRFHLAFGAALLVTFVLTGQYMDRVHDHLRGMADGPRMMYRSRHIYVLFAALVNLGLGAYLADRHAMARLLQCAGSGVIAISSALLVAAFFYDASHAVFDTPQLLYFSRFGILGMLAGVLFHATASVLPRPVDSVRADELNRRAGQQET